MGTRAKIGLIQQFATCCPKRRRARGRMPETSSGAALGTHARRKARLCTTPAVSCLRAHLRFRRVRTRAARPDYALRLRSRAYARTLDSGVYARAPQGQTVQYACGSRAYARTLLPLVLPATVLCFLTGPLVLSGTLALVCA